MKISFSFSHVPGDWCVLKLTASFINCQWRCLMASVNKGTQSLMYVLTSRVAVFKMISWYLTNLGDTIASWNACENAFFRFLSSSWPLGPGIRWFVFKLRFPCFDSLSAWSRDVETGQNRRNLERRANQEKSAFLGGLHFPLQKDWTKLMPVDECARSKDWKYC